MDLFKANITYKVERYEEWMSGRCITQGSLDLRIVSKLDGNKMHFKIDGNHQLSIPNTFDFNINESDILNDGRIQYMKAPGGYMNPIIPVICHLFIKGDTLDYVRFAMTNPDRLIEFYGYPIMVVQNNQEEDIERQYKLTFLASLINLAQCDGDVSIDELKIIKAYSARVGLSDADFAIAIMNPKVIKGTVTNDINERIMHLKDMVALAMIDGEFRQVEYDLCKKIAYSICIFRKQPIHDSGDTRSLF